MLWKAIKANAQLIRGHGILSKLPVRSVVLLGPEFIQNRDPKDEVPEGGRPCTAKVRW